MSNVNKEDRADGTEIRKLNNLGMGLKAIGRRVGCHPSTVKIKLQEMGIEPVDTRRNFMEDVYNSLTPEEAEWLADNLYNLQIPVKEFVTRVIREAYKAAPVAATAAPTPLPVPRSHVPSDEELEELRELGVTLSNITGEGREHVPAKDLFSE